MIKRLTDTLSAKTTGNPEYLIVCSPDSKAADLTKINQVDLLIDPSHQQEFIRWLKDTPIPDAAKQLGVSRAKAGRIRKAMGLSDEYTGGSRTTEWRRRKKSDEDEDMI